MKSIYWFNELSKDSLDIAGGKGANLGEMTSAGFPIPGGFIVSSQAYFSFIKESGVDKTIAGALSGLDVQDTEALQQASEKIKKAITNVPVPNDVRAEVVRAYNKLCGAGLFPNKEQEVLVAVRSSATAEDLPEASFAGQQETFLNVKGADQLVSAVRRCWASLFEARAIYYRQEQNFDHLKVGLSAVVQKMVQSDKSGVMFTVDPTSNKENDLVI
ncbi:MAG: PEP/pyruvate-binding domain-containing protein, partial [Candidatus Micrarchaeia archaeon]